MDKLYENSSMLINFTFFWRAFIMLANYLWWLWYIAYYNFLNRGFSDYMVSGGESAYQQLCNEITLEFNECSKQVGLTIAARSKTIFFHFLLSMLWYIPPLQVLSMETQFLSPDCFRDDLASLLRAVQVQEKQKLNLVCFPPLQFGFSDFFMF